MVGVVQQHGREGADAAQTVFTKQRGQRARVGGQEAFGAKLGGRQSGVAHLGEHPLGRELIAPAGHFAYAPRDGRSGNLRRCHDITSSMRTGARRRRDSVAASASHATSTASATVHAGAAVPLTTSTKAVSSARNASAKRSMKKW